MFVRSPFVRGVGCVAWWLAAAAFAQQLPSATNESSKNASEASSVAPSCEAVSDSPGSAEDGGALHRLAERLGGVTEAEVPPARGVPVVEQNDTTANSGGPGASLCSAPATHAEERSTQIQSASGGVPGVVEIPPALPQELLRPDRPTRSEPRAVESVSPAPLAAETPPEAERSGAGYSVSAAGAVEPGIEDRPLGPAPRATEGGEVAAAAGGESGSSGWIVKTLGALAVVIGLIFVVRSLLGRVAGSVTSSAFSPAVEVLSRVTVAPRNHILLVRLGKRVLVLGDSSAGLRRLADITEPDEVAGVLAAVGVGKANSISRGFGQLLERFNRDYRPEEDWAEEGVDGYEHAVDRARDQVGSLLSRVRALSGRGGGR